MKEVFVPKILTYVPTIKMHVFLESDIIFLIFDISGLDNNTTIFKSN